MDLQLKNLYDTFNACERRITERIDLSQRPDLRLCLLVIRTNIDRGVDIREALEALKYTFKRACLPVSPTCSSDMVQVGGAPWRWGIPENIDPEGFNMALVQIKLAWGILNATIRIDPKLLSFPGGPLWTRVRGGEALSCKTCGLSVETKEILAQHLDWHFKTNNMDPTRTRTTKNRGWFHKAEDWVKTDEVSIHLALVKTKKDLDEKDLEKFGGSRALCSLEDIPRVEADDIQTHCGFCLEKMLPIWDDDLEKWMLHYAIRGSAAPNNPSSTGSTKQIYHVECYQSLPKN